MDPVELAMYAALLSSNNNVEMVEYLMAGMWILMKHPENRRVLGSAFAINPSASQTARKMMTQMQATIEVADITDMVG